jgi:uncharacterized protein (DUF488 family)
MGWGRNSPDASMTTSTDFDLLTVGHSNLPADNFLALLKHAGVTAIIDVRSVPFSRRFPWFSARTLADRLAGRGIAYSAHGDRLGGRPADPAFYCDGVADYEAMAGTEEFHEGLAHVMESMRRNRVCLMCAEREPLDCHRCLLVGRALAARGCSIGHILGNGRIEPNAITEERLLARSGLAIDAGDRPARIAQAYRARSKAVAAKLNDRVRPGRKPRAFMPS